MNEKEFNALNESAEEICEYTANEREAPAPLLSTPASVFVSSRTDSAVAVHQSSALCVTSSPPLV